MSLHPLRRCIKYFIVSSRRLVLHALTQVFAKPLREYQNNLIIAPHPDDEVFGCGAMLANCTARGKRAEILFVTDGEASHHDCCKIPASKVGVQRKKLTVAANKILGVPQEHLYFLEVRDGELPRQGQVGFIELAEKIAAVIKKSEPEAIFCPHPFEGWSDHVAAEELTKTAINKLPIHIRPRLYHYCVWFWYSMPLTRAFRINWRQARFLDITKHLPVKQQAILVYLDGLAPCGNPWIGKLPTQSLRAFDWHKELFFEVNNDIK